MLDSGSRLHWDTHAHGYQRRALDHVVSRPSAALWLSPGYGKTSIVLHAFQRLLAEGKARHMLIVAPLRVVQTVWAQEIERWASLHGLRAARLHGPKKDVQLQRRDANVWLINYEGAEWLARMAKAGKVKTKFDVVVADEVRRLKNSQGHRFKALRPIFGVADYRWGLTGTPASNGLMDLYGQFLILDGGAALGKSIVRFRQEYFEQGWDGFTYVPRPGAQERIEAAVADYVFRAHGLLDLPDFIEDRRTVALDDKARKAYTALKNDMIAEVGDQPITAANAAVLYGKLKQLANGRVYDADGKVVPVHSAKADALRELVEELGDEQLLIAYHYQHDFDQIREVLGTGVPTLTGVTERVAQETVDRWNRREIQFLVANPASAGHGLNLQRGGAHHILWWGPTIDLDHYIQFNDRLRRQGNTADAVVLHTFVTENSVDESTIDARGEKASTQDALLSALTTVVGHDITIDVKGKEPVMNNPLQFKPDSALGGGQQPPVGAWGQPAATAPAAQQPPAAQWGQPAQPAATAPAAQQPPAAQWGQPAPAASQWGQPAPAASQGNPFGGGQAAQQREAIRDDVGHAPPPTAAQAFAHFGVAMGADNPAQPQSAPPTANLFQPGAQAPAPQEAAPAPAQSPQPTFSTSPDAIPDAEVVAEAPSEQAAQASGAAAAAWGADAMVGAMGAPAGMVPIFTYVPADKLVAVLRGIANAVK